MEAGSCTTDDQYSPAALSNLVASPTKHRSTVVADPKPRKKRHDKTALSCNLLDTEPISGLVNALGAHLPLLLRRAIANMTVMKLASRPSCRKLGEFLLMHDVSGKIEVRLSKVNSHLPFCLLADTRHRDTAEKLHDMLNNQ